MPSKQSLSTDAKSRRRWYQFRLRTLLIVVTISAVGFGILARDLRRHEREQRFFVWVLQQQGQLLTMADEDYYYFDDYNYHDYRFDGTTRALPSFAFVITVPPRSYWERITNSQPPFPVHVPAVDLAGTKVTDLTPLTDQPGLICLKLDDTEVSDLAPLAELTSLRLLRLPGTKVRDLTPLSDLKDLQILYLMNTQVTDLSPLVGLKKLEVVILDGTPVSDEQVRMLKKELPECNIVRHD